MRLRELKVGTEISEGIVVKKLLDSHGGISTYLASRGEGDHFLLFILPDFGEESLAQLNKSVKFAKDTTKKEVFCGIFEEFLYFCQPFPDGEFVYEWLERHERLSLLVALKMVVSLLRTLVLAHSQGIFHGRISPKTVLIESQNFGFGLHLMSLGVAQAMTPSLRENIDWFRYRFDLSDMTPVAIDVYGIAILLLAMVEGEDGVNVFKTTGVLPESFQGGLLQLSMERALGIIAEPYSDSLSFSQDLEAVMLDMDTAQDEVFVSSLVGFQSAVMNVVKLRDDADLNLECSAETSAIWQSIAEMCDEERHSVLTSLTSLTALRSMSGSDLDDEATSVMRMPKDLSGLHRIHTLGDDHPHPEKSSDNKSADEKISDNKATDEKEPEVKDETPTEDQKALQNDEIIEGPKFSAPDEETARKLEERYRQLLEEDAEDETDFDEDAPTRVMLRPNYIRFSAEPPTSSRSSIKAIIAEVIPEFIERIERKEVVTRTYELKHIFRYDPDDPVAFPPIPDNIEEEQEEERDDFDDDDSLDFSPRPRYSETESNTENEIIAKPEPDETELNTESKDTPEAEQNAPSEENAPRPSVHDVKSPAKTNKTAHFPAMAIVLTIILVLAFIISFIKWLGS